MGLRFSGKTWPVRSEKTTCFSTFFGPAWSKSVRPVQLGLIGFSGPAWPAPIQPVHKNRLSGPAPVKFGRLSGVIFFCFFVHHTKEYHLSVVTGKTDNCSGEKKLPGQDSWESYDKECNNTLVTLWVIKPFDNTSQNYTNIKWFQLLIDY